MRSHRPDLKWSDITPKPVFMNRRALIAGAAGLAIAGPATAKLAYTRSNYSTPDAPTDLEDITSYNNFYEFGFGKDDPAKYAAALTTDPWSVKIDGLVDRPGDYGLDDILKGVSLEERIYRFRCVEAWAMIVPWIGFPLSDLLDRVGVQSKA